MRKKTERKKGGRGHNCRGELKDKNADSKRGIKGKMGTQVWKRNGATALGR